MFLHLFDINFSLSLAVILNESGKCLGAKNLFLCGGTNNIVPSRLNNTSSCTTVFSTRNEVQIRGIVLLGNTILDRLNAFLDPALFLTNAVACLFLKGFDSFCVVCENLIHLLCHMLSVVRRFIRVWVWKLQAVLLSGGFYVAHTNDVQLVTRVC